MRGEVRDNLKTGSIAASEEEGSGISVEKQQEILLVNKMAASGKLPPKTQSIFLQKKLQQRKFFDSGDYAMNQNKEKKIINLGGGGGIPQVDIQQHSEPSEPVVSPINKLQSQLPIGDPQKSPVDDVPALSPALRPPPISCITSGGSMEGGDSDEEGGHLQIPRPDTVPQRKASILHPSVYSKLSPQPHIHHEYNDESITAAPE